MKRYFLIEIGRYGGEFAMGRCNPDFVEYWIDREDMSDHVHAIDWGDDDDIDPNSPPMRADGTNCAWHELDDIWHENGGYSDTGYYLTEIKLKDGVRWEDGALVSDDKENYTPIYDMYEAISEYQHIDTVGQIYSREFYTSPIEQIKKHGYEPVPVFMTMSGEKGQFGVFIIETDGEDFDPSLLAISITETDLAELSEYYFYDGKQMELNYDYADTTGKYIEFKVGYVAMEWIDPQPSEEQLQELINDWRETRNWQLENEE